MGIWGLNKKEHVNVPKGKCKPWGKKHGWLGVAERRNTAKYDVRQIWTDVLSLSGEDQDWDFSRR